MRKNILGFIFLNMLLGMIVSVYGDVEVPTPAYAQQNVIQEVAEVKTTEEVVAEVVEKVDIDKEDVGELIDKYAKSEISSPSINTLKLVAVASSNIMDYADVEETIDEDYIIDPELPVGVINGEEYELPEIPFDISMVSLKPNEKSNLSVEQISQILEGNNLQKHAADYKDMEDMHGVNALYAISVSRLECGNGTSRRYREQHNLFGVKRKSGGFRTFSSERESILDFGRMMNDVYFSRGRDTIEEIAPVYCNASWGPKVNRIMNGMYAKL